MSDTVHSLSTSGLTPKKQIQTWSDALTDLCGQFDVDPLEASSFEGRINYATVSQLKLCQIEASQHRISHRVSHPKLSEHPFVKILFQTYGISHFEQAGRRIDLMPGDCLAYDVSCPHTIVSPSLTRHEVVIVPKELLRERGFHFGKMSACKLSALTGTGRIAHEFVLAAFDLYPTQGSRHDVRLDGFKNAVADADRSAKCLVHAFETGRDIDAVSHHRIAEPF